MIGAFAAPRHVSAPSAIAGAYALLVAAVLGYCLFGIPVQVSDSFGNLLQVQEPSLGDVVTSQLHQRGFLRPLLWAQIKIGYELAGGQYYLFFRGLHALQAATVIGLAMLLMRPRTAIDASVVPLALAALVGVHTFAGTLREAFPINTFLTIVVCCLAAANLALARHAWWVDVAAVALFLFAVLTVESGVLVWVIFVAAYMLRARGVSRAGLAAVSVALAAYLAVRFWVLDVGSPGLMERAAGYGFRVREPEELAATFGGNPAGFYAYNVLSSIAGVLFSEPRGGVWRTVDTFLRDGVQPWDRVCVATSLLTTGVLAWFAWTRRAAWLARRFDRSDRLVLLFAAVLAANAVLSYAYTKDVIMSPSGVFLAIALFVAAREWLVALDARGWPIRQTTLTIVFGTLLVSGWSYRVVGLHLNLRQMALDVRNEWVQVDRWLTQQRLATATPDARALKEELRRDAVWRPTPPQFLGSWTRGFDRDW